MGIAGALVVFVCADLAASSSRAAESVLPPPAPVDPAAPMLVLQPERSLDFQLYAGVSVATIQVDGSAQTGFLPGGLIEFHQGMLSAGILFDADPSRDSDSTSGENRSGWHLGALVGPSFALSSALRFDLLGEVGLHQFSDSGAINSATYDMSATLPYVGLRPSLSLLLGSGKISAALGAAAFFRLDAGQKQGDGLPDDGGHQLGLMAFLSLHVALL